MLVAIRRLDNSRAEAWIETKDRGPWICPECRSEVIHKSGRIRVPHFAHRPPVTCAYGLGESDAHRRCKMAIYEAMLEDPRVTECAIERDLGSVRPDVSAYVDGKPLAIEVQASCLSMDRIIARTTEYMTKRVPVLWTGLWQDALLADQYAPKVWEKWLHAVYFGRIYYWQSGLDLIPVHFGDHMLWVEESQWYDSAGESRTAGGYERRSKRYRTPQRAPSTVNLVSGMSTRVRAAWTGGDLVVPKCSIRVDRLPTWWKE